MSVIKFVLVGRPDCADLYGLLDHTNAELMELERMQAEIAKQAALFEVPVTEVRHLVTTRKDLTTVKVFFKFKFLSEIDLS